jgi:hypothetical protein
MPVLVDNVEGVSRNGPYFFFHDEDSLFWDAVGRVYAQWWGQGGELIVHFVFPYGNGFCSSIWVVEDS